MGWTWKTTKCSTNATYPYSLSDQFNFSKRIHSWCVFICDSELEDITLGFLFNMQGVAPNLPWFDIAKSNLGMSGYPPPGTEHSITVRDTFLKAQGPAISPLIHSMGGPPDAITVNSAFWDIGRLVTGKLGKEGGIDTCENMKHRAKWVESWAKNATVLIDTIVELFPETKWLGWRTANLITVPIPPCRTEMILEMNEAAKLFSRKKGIHIADYFSIPNMSKNMRDPVHPNTQINAAYMENLIQRIRKNLKT